MKYLMDDWRLLVALLGLSEKELLCQRLCNGVADGGLSKEYIQLNIMLTYQCNVDPLTPQFYIVKQVYRGIHFFSSPEPKAHR